MNNENTETVVDDPTWEVGFMADAFWADGMREAREGTAPVGMEQAGIMILLADIVESLRGIRKALETDRGI